MYDPGFLKAVTETHHQALGEHPSLKHTFTWKANLWSRVPGESTMGLQNVPFRHWYTAGAGAISHATLE